MGRRTPEETREMKYEKLVKEIWGKEFNLAKDELTEVFMGKHFMTIKTSGKQIDSHRSFFDNYFFAVGGEKSTKTAPIKKTLEQLL
ncbi:MAG: hypothetical protein HQL09_01940 [Nitrospirae bacterium]|nr:hypothetical protein [Nitrospirota bacterium]